MVLVKLKNDAKKFSNLKRKEANEWFFKTGKGQYGEGDKFIGISMPDARKIAKKYIDLKDDKIEELLHTNIHEHRMIALLIWTYQFDKANKKRRKEIYEKYLKNTKWINNWDLVDVTCNRIVGFYLLDKNRKILYKLARSKSIWERRIAIVSSGVFVAKKNEFDDTLKISKTLLKDDHDLIHKAVGWMLREVGKKDADVLREFLKDNYSDLPRTTLRYAIEKFSEEERKMWLAWKI